MGENELVIQFAPRIFLKFDCPHCQKRVSIQYRWLPEVIEVKKEEVK